MLRIVLLALGIPWSCVSLAAPFIPDSDDQVLERLPAALHTNRQSGSELKLRAALRENPSDVDAAAALAWHYVRLGRTTGDPRFTGYAQSVLRPWWDELRPPTRMLLRATLNQNRHDFPRALADLDLLLSQDPRNAQAWLSKAVIHLVRGELDASRNACLAALHLGRRLLGGTCIAEVLARTGRAREALAVLERLLVSGYAAALESRRWALTSSAETAARLNRMGLAESRFLEAIALGPPDIHLLGVYSDFLLDQGRYEAVLALLDGKPAASALVLRRAIAERRLGLAGFVHHRDMLHRRLESERRRGGPGHPGTETRLLLYLQDRPAAALERAKTWWRDQKEPAAAALLLEAAWLTGSHDAARPVLAWFRETGLEDARLRVLAARFEQTES